MAKRIKRIKTGIESIKEEIENHFKKIEEDIKIGNFDRGKYHVKEVDQSLIYALKYKLELLGEHDEDENIKKYEERLKILKDKINEEEKRDE